MSKKVFSLKISSLSEDGARGAVIVNGKTYFNKVVTKDLVKEKDMPTYISAENKKIIKIHDIKDTSTGEDVTSNYIKIEVKALPKVKIPVKIKVPVPVEIPVKIKVPVPVEIPVEIKVEIPVEIKEPIKPEPEPEVKIEEKPKAPGMRGKRYSIN